MKYISPRLFNHAITLDISSAKRVLLNFGSLIGKIHQRSANLARQWTNAINMTKKPTNKK